MTYVRAQLRQRLSRQVWRAWRQCGCTPPAATASFSSGHPQAAAVSAVDSAVRTPGRGSAALPDTEHCRSRPDGYSRTWPPLMFPHRRLGVAMPGGGRSCSPHFDWP
jgi:hypothetical protein